MVLRGIASAGINVLPSAHIPASKENRFPLLSTGTFISSSFASAETTTTTIFVESAQFANPACLY